MTPEEVLRQVFGYSSFRPGQKEVIEAVLAGRDCVGVMPTGAGKSLCYQLPALELPGVTLVVSPLIALMKDQHDKLVELGIDVLRLDSTLSPRDEQAALDAAVLAAAAEYSQSSDATAAEAVARKYFAENLKHDNGGTITYFGIDGSTGEIVARSGTEVETTLMKPFDVDSISVNANARAAIRKYDVDTSRFMQFWSSIVALG